MDRYLVKYTVNFPDHNIALEEEMVAERMTPADISKAQQLARECVAKNYEGC